MLKSGALMFKHGTPLGVRGPRTRARTAS